ncbi:hypothetical protein BARRETLEMON_57 [Arthrobacter phage BarretLemon]|uniref:Uncharacterized protein n=2 Tax=Marthavirus barretlemon TaxID=2560300 RepID=A0A386KLK6_9CAUD|nr:hypothetical protein BJD79_gp57 [Arthrobacter phage BarretLemon]AMM44519.1 hypothetical protein BARRETLEMON_57 [Arthrobacter phage BarretLemon]AYD86528.1 hypothetical protein SEA_LEEROYJ_57 [Arthrobacter phage LeeroyJ]
MNEQHLELAQALYVARRPGGIWKYMTDRQKDSYLRAAARLADALPHLGYTKEDSK